MTVPGAPAGQTRGEFASLLDCTATILELAGLGPSQRSTAEACCPWYAARPPADWPGHLIAEFNGRHFPVPAAVGCTDRHKLVVNPELRNELYDLHADPHELTNRYDDQALLAVRRDLLRRLYLALRERGDNFYHWMTSMHEAGEKDYDTSPSPLETTSETGSLITYP